MSEISEKRLCKTYSKNFLNAFLGVNKYFFETLVVSLWKYLDSSEAEWPLKFSLFRTVGDPMAQVSDKNLEIRQFSNPIATP